MDLEELMELKPAQLARSTGGFSICTADAVPRYGGIVICDDESRTQIKLPSLKDDETFRQAVKMVIEKIASCGLLSPIAVIAFNKADLESVKDVVYNDKTAKVIVDTSNWEQLL